MAELILFAGSPDKDFAIVSKSHGMVSTANDLFHVAEIWEPGWGRLDFDIFREAQYAFIALRNS